ncbi:MAG: hypothetical protein K8L97_26395 [Anaerolineae bacterium]|nr:hypothetical protein [Anaerolineae bacterium]
MWRVLLILMLMVVPIGAQAQQNSWWEDGCDARAVALIEPTEGQFDYGAACAAYRTCDPNGEGDFRCQMIAFNTLLEQCPAGDAICPKTAMLYAAAILAFDMPFGESIDWIPPQSIRDGVPVALAAFQAGDYGQAIEAYQMTPFVVESGETMMPFSRGVVYEMLGESQAALGEYASVFQVEFEHPLAWYARAQLYGSLGRTDEASFDAESLAIFTGDMPELAGLVDDLKAQYPLDTNKVQDWLMYPVESTSFGVGGTFFADHTLEAGRPVQVGFYVDLDAILVIGVSRLLGGGSDDDYRWVQLLNGADDGRYRLDYPSYWDNFGSLILTIEDEHLSGSESISYFEGAAAFEFVLVPASFPDPRLSLEDHRLCAGSVRSRVTVGSFVETPWHGGDPIPLYGVAGGGEIGGSPALTVIGGPECIGSVTWWEARDTIGNTGWFPENEGNQYTVNPLAEEPTQANTCPLMPRLTEGGTGRVIVGLGANNMRSQPSANSALVAAIPEGEVFTVEFGPTCAEGIHWWQVTYGGLAGWTAEGDINTYWVEPNG